MIQNKVVYLILFLIASFFLISSSASSSSLFVKTQKCTIDQTKGSPGYFKVKITGSYVKDRFVLKKVRYVFGPGGRYGDSNNFFIYYIKPNDKKDQWNSPDNLEATGGAMRGFKNFKPIRIKKGSRINIKGYFDAIASKDESCTNSFRV